MPHQRKLEWGKWFEARSRNLSRIREPEQFAKALCTGIAEIGEGLARIPGTKHDLSQPNHFVVDASAIDSGVLMVTVHGQFTEVETQGVRSFDRTFVLAPAAFGSPAQQHGWPVQIVSDLWVIRGYSHPDVWTPGAKLLAQDEAARGATFGAQSGAGFTASAPPAVSVAPPVTPAGPTPETIFAALPADDQALVSTVTDVARRNTLLAFCARSGLRVMFAGQCLEGNGWDPEAAWANFQTVRVSLSGFIIFGLALMYLSARHNSGPSRLSRSKHILSCVTFSCPMTGLPKVSISLPISTYSLEILSLVPSAFPVIQQVNTTSLSHHRFPACLLTRAVAVVASSLFPFSGYFS